MVALKETVNFFWSGMWGAVRAIGQLLQEVGKTFVALFGVVTTVEFWKGLGNALISMALEFNSLLLRGIGRVLTEVAKIPGFGKLKVAADAATQQGQAMHDKANDFATRSAGQLENTFAVISARLDEAAAKIFDAFKRGTGTDDLFKTDAEKKAIADLLEKIKAAQDALKAAAKKDEPAKKTGTNPEMNFAPRSGLPGGFAQAVNFLMGRSINELILEENKSQTAALLDINSNLIDIGKNLGKPPEVKVVMDPTARFN